MPTMTFTEEEKSEMRLRLKSLHSASAVVRVQRCISTRNNELCEKEMLGRNLPAVVAAIVEVLERVGRITDGGLPVVDGHLRNLSGLPQVLPILPHIPPVLSYISLQQAVLGNYDTTAHGGGHYYNLEYCS